LDRLGNSSARAARLASDLRAALFGYVKILPRNIPIKFQKPESMKSFRLMNFFRPHEIADAFFHPHAFSPILIAYKDGSTVFISIDKYLVTGGNHVFGLLKEKEKEIQARVKSQVARALKEKELEARGQAKFSEIYSCPMPEQPRMFYPGKRGKGGKGGNRGNGGKRGKGAEEGKGSKGKGSEAN
jgi:hypothetical protein